MALFLCAGKATILELETTTSLRESGEILCMNRSIIGPYYFTDHHNLQKSSAVILLCNAGVLSTCVVLEASPTLPGRSHTQLTLTMRFQMLHFQIPRLLRYTKTTHRIPRHETSSMHKFPFSFYLPFYGEVHSGEQNIFIFPLLVHLFEHGPAFFWSWSIVLTQKTS